MTTTPINSGVRLDDLIEAIKRVHTDPLEQLTDAALAADHLGEIADHLVGHFVDQARRSGSSWRDIGTSMGVTKQAAQKRFVAKDPGLAEMLDPAQGFSRFTLRARNVVVAAQNEASTAGNAEISPLHLVLGLLTEPDGLAIRAIQHQGATVRALHDAAVAILPPPADDVPDLIPFDADARKVLELTLREALRMGHNYVGTEHVLLALLEDGSEGGVLASAGITKATTENEVAAMLAGIGADPS